MFERRILRRTLLSALLASCALPTHALYDPAPDPALAAAQGEWQGNLTYRDYSKPDRLVTLPTRLFVVLGAPNEWVLHYVFDDGPGKTVYSYEKMAFDFAAQRLTWSSSGKEAEVNVSRITGSVAEGASRRMVFERADGAVTDRYTLEMSAGSLSLSKDEVDTAGVSTLRNKYQFTRPAGKH